MNLALDTPLVLALLPLALLPLVFAVQKAQGYPSLAAVVPDPMSRTVDIGLHVLGALSIAALIAAIGGVHLKGQTIERVGEGAHIVLLLDRSSSMDDTFAGRPPGDGEASKSAAARRLLRDFIARRPHDRFGVAAFSTLPMPVLPITSHTDAVLGAIDAIARPGLAFTNVGLGLTLGAGDARGRSDRRFARHPARLRRRRRDRPTRAGEAARADRQAAGQSLLALPAHRRRAGHLRSAR